MRAWSGSLLATLLLLFAGAASRSETVLREGWRVESSAKVNSTGDKISLPGFGDSAWYVTSVPKTVFAVQVEHGLYRNPYYGMNLRSVPGVEYKIGGQFANMDMPANSPYAVPWWYRREFDLPASEQ